MIVARFPGVTLLVFPLTSLEDLRVTHANHCPSDRENRTITVDFHNEAPYVQLLGDGKAFVECVLALLLALGFQLAHKATCRGGGCLTRHSHYARVRLGGLTIWRVQCTTCKAVSRDTRCRTYRLSSHDTQDLSSLCAGDTAQETR